MNISYTKSVRADEDAVQHAVTAGIKAFSNTNAHNTLTHHLSTHIHSKYRITNLALMRVSL